MHRLPTLFIIFLLKYGIHFYLTGSLMPPKLFKISNLTTCGCSLTTGLLFCFLKIIQYISVEWFLCLMPCQGKFPLEEKSGYLHTNRDPVVVCMGGVHLLLKKEFLQVLLIHYLPYWHDWRKMIQIYSLNLQIFDCFPYNNNEIVTLTIMVIQSLPKMILLTKQIREIMQHGWSILEFFGKTLPLSGK